MNDGYAECNCGSAWFELRPGRRTTGDGEVQLPGVVSLSSDGQVTGYAGIFLCSECGEEWIPARERLRVVRG